GSIADVKTSGSRTIVMGRQDGQMPSPVVLKRQSEPSAPASKPMANAKMVGDTTAIVTWPVDVWFIGNRTFQATLDFGGGAIPAITPDPGWRLPPRDVRDNVSPRCQPAPPAAAQGGAGRGAQCGAE